MDRMDQADQVRNILIIAEETNDLRVSVKDNLPEEPYLVETLPVDLEAVYMAFSKPVHGIILLEVNTKLREWQELLRTLKNWVTRDYIPVFGVGGPDSFKTLGPIFPQHLLYLIPKETEAATNPAAIAAQIDSFLRQFTVKKKKRNGRILVVDDSGAMLRAVKSWLDDKYHVALANSGIAAIKSMALNKPDLILLDYDMPVCNGKQVLEMIRMELEYVDLPVIFLTRRGDPAAVRGVRELKPERYLLKTLDPYLIVKAVDEFFEKREKRKAVLWEG